MVAVIAHSLSHRLFTCSLLLLLTFRSTEMDKWTQEQLKTMQMGGNENARNFFKDKGWSDVSAKVRLVLGNGIGRGASPFFSNAIAQLSQSYTTAAAAATAAACSDRSTRNTPPARRRCTSSTLLAWCTAGRARRTTTTTAPRRTTAAAAAALALAPPPRKALSSQSSCRRPRPLR